MSEATTTREAAAVETVQMEDGRSVDFVGKRKMLKETLIDGNSVTVRLDFRNGKTLSWTIPDELLLKTAGHGAEQKLGDETAGVADVDDMYIAVEELIARLNKGEWATKREGGGFAGTSVLLRALVEFSGRTTEQIKEFLAGKTQAEKMALRSENTRTNSAGNTLKMIVDRLESEKVAKSAKVNTGDLLDALS